jgi:hypothetical protein
MDVQGAAPYLGETPNVFRSAKTRKGAIGTDFGTTNSSIACANNSEEAQFAKFPYLGDLTHSYRSLLYLQQEMCAALFTARKADIPGENGISHAHIC